MSDKIFLDVVNMSITGSFAILIIILVRLLLRKAPKVFSYTLWFVAFFRLLVPFSFESVLSILPFNTMPLSTDMLYIETPCVETGIKVIDNVINPEDNMVYWCFHIFATYHTLIFHSQREITERRPFTG